MNIIKIKNFKPKFNIKILLSNIIGTVILLIFTNLTISYSAGNFEIPFIDRNQSNNVTIEYKLKPSEENITSAKERAEDITNVQVVINPDDFIEATESRGAEQSAAGNSVDNTEPATEPAPVFELYSDDIKRQGYTVSDAVYEDYNEEKINMAKNAYKAEVEKVLNDGSDSQYMPPEPVLYQYKFIKVEPEVAIPKLQRISDSTRFTVKNTVEPFMDYIIIRDENMSETLCDASGKIIMKGFESSGFEILKMRTHDDYNRTVFKYGDAYYIYEPYIDDEGKTVNFANIQFDELLGDRGVPFMYPSYYGANGANNLYRNYTYLNRWGYLSSDTDKQMIRAIYNRSFNFNENIGISYLDSAGRGNKLYFLNENGADLLAALGKEYFAPSTSETTANSLGYFYFDHGLTRAFSREFDATVMGTVEKELILELKSDANGNAYFKEFYVPEDYTVRAYSNGMILLEKDGWYGFMNHLGEWVAQPIYRYAQPFFEGVAVIGLENGKKALIDTKGNLVIKFKYDAITNCTGGIVAVYEKNEGWTILNKVRRKIEIY